MASSKLLTPQAAAALIADGAVVSVSSSSGLNCPDRMLEAIGERFAREGHPRGLTTLHPIAAGDMYGITRHRPHRASPGCSRACSPAPIRPGRRRPSRRQSGR